MPLEKIISLIIEDPDALKILSTTNSRFYRKIEAYLKQERILTSARIFNEYNPTFLALESKESLTPTQVSKLTGNTKEVEERRLEHFYRAGIVGKNGRRYFFTDESSENIRKTFGVEAILLSGCMSTETQMDLECRIRGD